MLALSVAYPSSDALVALGPLLPIELVGGDEGHPPLRGFVMLDTGSNGTVLGKDVADHLGVALDGSIEVDTAVNSGRLTKAEATLVVVVPGENGGADRVSVPEARVYLTTGEYGELKHPGANLPEAFRGLGFPPKLLGVVGRQFLAERGWALEISVGQGVFSVRG